MTEETRFERFKRLQGEIGARITRSIEDALWAAPGEECALHDEPMQDYGGGPGAFSICPSCYRGLPAKA